MLSNCKIIFFSFFLTGLVQAKSYNPTVGEKEGCELKVERIGKVNRTNLKCDGIKFESEQAHLDNMFLRWSSVKTKNDTYIMLFFSNGVHGERGIVFSKNKKEQIKDLASSWPIELVRGKSNYRLNFKLDSNEKGEYPPHFYDLN